MFLKRNAKAGTVVGFYNGVRLVGMESKVSEAVRRSPYRMDNDWSRHEEILDIPSHYRSVVIQSTILRDEVIKEISRDLNSVHPFNEIGFFCLQIQHFCDLIIVGLLTGLFGAIF